MRSTFYTSDRLIYAELASIAQNGWLIVVPDGDVRCMEDLLRTFDRKCMRDLVELHPTMNADEARRQSVEVRTVAEMETMESNERQAMEV